MTSSRVGRRAAGAVAIAAIALASVTLPAGATSSATGQEAPAGPVDAPVSAAAVTATTSWTRQITAGGAVSTSSPVLVHNGGNPIVAAADNRGNVRGFRLSDGQPAGNWGSASVGFPVRAPLSSDGANVYVPVAQDGKDRYPRYKKFSAAGSAVWDSNPTTRLPSSPTSGFLLSGLSLARVDGALRGFGGSSGHWIYGVNASSGAKAWEFRNADSTMATPAVADMYGAGRPQVVTSNDTTAEFPHDRHGGILRILDADGRQLCTATQLVNGSTYAASGYNNSSPVIGVVDGRPLIAFGSTGPVQHGVGGNQVVAYDETCAFRWASPPLAAQAGPSPSLADVMGNGTLQVVQVVAMTEGTATYPRVYVLNASTGAILRDSGTSLRPYRASIAFPPSVQITTADVDGDGGQDLFVPAKQGSYLILDGSTLGVLGTVPTNMVVQNTPIVSEEANGVRLTMAGYNPAGSVVSSYLVAGASLGDDGWHSFGNGPELTGTQGDVSGPRDQIIEGQTLPSGGVLRSRTGGFTATMQTDGNLVVRAGDNSVRWQTGTSVPGSALRLERDGRLAVRAPNGAWQWSSGALGFGTERLALGNDGLLRVWTGHWSATRRLTSLTNVWRSGSVQPPGASLARGQILPPGAFIRSADGGVLQMQTDGNLVYRRGNSVVWHAGTRDTSGNAYAQFRHDGDLVVIGSVDRLIFSTQTNGRGGVSLTARNAQTLAIHDASGRNIWVNGTRVK